MTQIQNLKNSLLWILSLLGVSIFYINLVVQDIPAKIQMGDQAKKAIQMLDEMRRPILSMKNAEYKDNHLSPNERYQQFKQYQEQAFNLITSYLAAAAYNPELLNSVKKLEAKLQQWSQIEDNLWQQHLSLHTNNVSNNEPPEIQRLHHQSATLFFQALNILAEGEHPVHTDIDNGTHASNILKISGAILIVYLFILIFIFQTLKTRELRHHKEELEKKVDARTQELVRKNKELSAFSYSVAHDLRAPLRSLDGFSQALAEDYKEQLDDTANDYLSRIRKASQKMGSLIDDMLELSRISKEEINKQALDISGMAKEILNNLQATQPNRHVDIIIEDGLTAHGDKQLIHAALTNLLSNAWKYSSKKEHSIIELGVSAQAPNEFFIKDNGAGFDEKYIDKLFNAFQRLHGSEFEGNGIGLATVKRIVERHNGSIRAESKIDQGACFYFKI